MMQGRKLNLKSYDAEVGLDGNDQPILRSYNVRYSLAQVLFEDKLQLDHLQVLEAHDLAQRIRKCEDDELIVSEQDFGRIRRAIECLRGLHDRDVPFVERFAQSAVPKVELAEKPKAG